MLLHSMQLPNLAWMNATTTRDNAPSIVKRSIAKNNPKDVSLFIGSNNVGGNEIFQHSILNYRHIRSVAGFHTSISFARSKYSSLDDVMIERFIIFVVLLFVGLSGSSYGQGRSECTKQEKSDMVKKGYTAAEIQQVCESILPGGGGTQCCCRKEKIRYNASSIISHEWVAADLCLAKDNTAVTTYQCVQPSFCAR